MDAYLTRLVRRFSIMVTSSDVIFLAGPELPKRYLVRERALEYTMEHEEGSLGGKRFTDRLSRLFLSED